MRPVQKRTRLAHTAPVRAHHMQEAQHQTSLLVLSRDSHPFHRAQKARKPNRQAENGQVVLLENKTKARRLYHAQIKLSFIFRRKVQRNKTGLDSTKTARPSSFGELGRAAAQPAARKLEQSKRRMLRSARFEAFNQL